MSDMRIALVAEGPTDYEVIQASLLAILPRSFVLTPLQPERTRPDMGTGWSGVLKWCNAAGRRHAGTLDADPTLEGFDLLIIHLDVDVTAASYEDCGPAVNEMALAHGWAALPCAQPCPPASASVQPLTDALMSWLQPAQMGAKTVLCLPAQSIGAWLAAATLPAGHALLSVAECNVQLESRLKNLPLGQRIKKTSRDYRAAAGKVSANWAAIRAHCGQARAFEQAVLAAL